MTILLFLFVNSIQAQQDCLIYTDKTIYFPGDKLCLRVIWPYQIEHAYLQTASSTAEVQVQQILDFEGSRSYANCLELPDSLRSGTHSITVIDNQGTSLTTSILRYNDEFPNYNSTASITWEKPPNLRAKSLPGTNAITAITKPVKEEELELNLPGKLVSYHVSVSDAKFTAKSTWMSRTKSQIDSKPAVKVAGEIDLADSKIDRADSKQPLLLANFIGDTGYFSGATVQRNSGFQLNELNIKGPTKMKLFLPAELKGSSIQVQQRYPVISEEEFSDISLPETLRDTLDIYLKLSRNYTSSDEIPLNTENDLFTNVKRSYLMNEHLPLPTVEDVITDILVGVKVIKKDGQPVDVMIRDDLLLTLNEPVPPLIFVNNNLLSDNSVVFSLPVASIYRIALIPSVDARDIFGYVGIGGALSFSLSEDVASISADAEAEVQGILPEGVIRSPEMAATRPDFRSTLIWSGILSQKVPKIDFVTTSFSGDYVVRISGINQQGQVEYYQLPLKLVFE